eukprot:474350-Prorocentrum_minimum.AAC.1
MAWVSMDDVAGPGGEAAANNMGSFQGIYAAKQVSQGFRGLEKRTPDSLRRPKSEASQSVREEALSNTKRSHRLTISPFHRLAISPSHHLTVSPFHRLTISPFHHFTVSPFHRLT